MNYLVLGMEIALILVQVYQDSKVFDYLCRLFLIKYFIKRIDISYLMFCDDHCGILDLSKRRRFYKNNRMVTGILSCCCLCISAGWSVYGIT